MSEKEVDVSKDITDIGTLLKEQRTAKNMSIDDVQEITKIRSRYIQAIEDGNLDKLPGQFYAKAFIKAYAEVVGLDPTILEDYQGKIPNPDVEKVQIKPTYNSASSISSKLGKWLVSSLVYILIALMLLFAYMFYVNYSSDKPDEELPGDPFEGQRMEEVIPDASTKENNNKNSTPSEQNNKPNEVVNPEPKIEVNKLSSSTYKYKPYDIYEVKVEEGTNVSVKLKFTERCWFDIRDGGANGTQITSTTLDKGQETEAFSLNQQIWLHLGNAAGAEIYINDKKIKAGTGNQDAKFISIKKTSK